MSPTLSGRSGITPGFGGGGIQPPPQPGPHPGPHPGGGPAGGPGGPPWAPGPHPMSCDTTTSHFPYVSVRPVP
ncbi:hypothetical protein ACFC0S_34650 [Streptomyces sp. NPDC056084]|uniref:hypothetical protein n=1 Tax=unclassified Streptomyces TaxID=2593676 RepID=UPI0035E03CC8